MKISFNWLRQFIKPQQNPEQIAEILTDLGLEVEGITPFQTVKGGLKGLVVGQVLSCEKHPNADRLKVTTVDVNADKPLQIVCGAPNVATGQKVPVALVGSTLYDKDGKPWEIKKGKIRGEVSEGMICAEDEIGLGESHDGIMVLDETLTPGTPLSEIFEIEDDTVFEIGLTPNRADAMSHMGVARDLRAGLAQNHKLLELITPSVSAFNVDNRSLKIDVEVADKNLAPRYCGLTLTEVTVKESPAWLQNRLKAIGISPKNNVVDVTNYVLHELGQPLHAFDASKIKGNKILVKTLKEGTEFVTLDGEKRKLHPEDLMICDTEKPLCIAGVFGGLQSGVSEQTTSIFLESAYFNAVSVRKTSKRHGLNTDASFRFERGIDINMVDYALKRAAILICELADAKISSDLVDLYPKKFEDHKVFLTYEKVNNLIGENLPQEVIKRILSYLEIKVVNVTETGMGLSIPPYRVDVTREADVIEEILRIYGYNNIHSSEKFHATIASVSRFEDYKLQNIACEQLVAQGFYETLNNSLTSPEYAQSEAVNADHLVNIINPLSTDLSVMRHSLLFGCLETVLHNLNRKNNHLKLFEFGKTYHKTGNSFQEKKALALVITGMDKEENWYETQKPGDFYLLKGYVNSLLERFGITNYETSPGNSEGLTDVVQFKLNQSTLADLGTVKGALLKHLGIKQPVYFAHIHWETLTSFVKKGHNRFTEPPKFPSVRRDLALLVNRDISYAQLYEVARKAEKKHLKAIDLFDVYEGKNLPEGKKSYAMSFILQDDNKTLVDKQIEKIMSQIQTALENEIGVTVRD